MSSRAAGSARAQVGDLDGFDAILDARSPGEFALDHVPGAINLPVLDDAQRAQVGTLHKQVSAFAARRTGAALVARNIAAHLEGPLAGHGPAWRALVYCWRGGKRSQSLTHVLREVGWDARQLEGGYKAFRRHLVEDLATLPGRLRWVAVCGLTGTGKSRLLQALEQAGAQVLDLEELAAHRGSVLGERPDQAQPSQKLFESRLWARLRRFDPQRPVYVESESKRIGLLQVPAELLQGLRAGRCVQLEADLPVRVALLCDEYRHFLEDVASLNARLGHLAALHGHVRIEQWRALAHAGHWQVLVEQLLVDHYDPAYRRSTGVNFPDLAQAPRVRVAAADPQAFAQAAAQVLELG